MKVQRTIRPAPTMENVIRWNEINSRVMSGNISFGATMQNQTPDQNLSVWKASGTTPGTANTDFTITHSLGRVPLTIVGQDTDNGGLLYRSSVTAWTETSVTLRCTTASAAYKVILA